VEAILYLNSLVEHNMQLFCFDFAGSGMSEGDFISLGESESEDIQVVV
jgi:alpha/beta superfamily hydrolase